MGENCADTGTLRQNARGTGERGKSERDTGALRKKAGGTGMLGKNEPDAGALHQVVPIIIYMKWITVE